MMPRLHSYVLGPWLGNLLMESLCSGIWPQGLVHEHRCVKITHSCEFAKNRPFLMLWNESSRCQSAFCCFSKTAYDRTYSRACSTTGKSYWFQMWSDGSTGFRFLLTRPWLISSNITGPEYRSKLSKVRSNLDRNLLIKSQRTLWAEFYFLGISFGPWFRQDLLAFSKLEIQESRLHISCTQTHIPAPSGCTFFNSAFSWPSL